MTTTMTKPIKAGITPEEITSLRENEVFVFGSNLNGHHAGGAAKIAMDWGAEWGKPEGLQGKTYALPTLGANHEQLTTDQLRAYVQNLYKTVQAFPQSNFLVTKVGCGIAGFSIEEIAPLFTSFANLINCSLPQEFIDYIKTH